MAVLDLIMIITHILVSTLVLWWLSINLTPLEKTITDALKVTLPMGVLAVIFKFSLAGSLMMFLSIVFMLIVSILLLKHIYRLTNKQTFYIWVAWISLTVIVDIVIGVIFGLLTYYVRY